MVNRAVEEWIRYPERKELCPEESKRKGVNRIRWPERQACPAEGGEVFAVNWNRDAVRRICRPV